MEHSISEWAPPILFASNKDGRLRFCDYCRKLNQITTKDSYSLAQMDDCSEFLGESKLFTSLDAFNGYRKVSIASKDLHKTSFFCHAGTYQYIPIPCSLRNAPDNYQRVIDMFLIKLKSNAFLFYMYYVII